LSNLNRNKKVEGFYCITFIAVTIIIILFIGSFFANAQSIPSLQNKGQSAYASLAGLLLHLPDSSDARTLNGIYHQYSIYTNALYPASKFDPTLSSKNVVGNTRANSSTKVVMINFDDGRKRF
jgi:hypothetical protein